jgi:hypothetical protein
MKSSLVFLLLLLPAALCAAEPKATRFLEGDKTTFPAKSMDEGVRVLIAALKSCHDMSDGTVMYSAEDLKKAQSGEHVRFEFPEPREVTILGEELIVSEVVFAKGVFWIVNGTDVVRCTKYTFDKFEPFRKWYQQTLPVDK